MSSGVPASASMRPSWPPPITPIFMFVSLALRLTRSRIVEHRAGLLFAELLERRMILRVLAAEDARRQQRGIGGAGLADGQGGDRHAAGHLHDGQQGVHAG